MPALEKTCLVKRGWVYVIVAPGSGGIKVGMAAEGNERGGRFDNLYNRYSAASNYTFEPLYVHSETFHGDVKQAEWEAHQRLAHARFGGGGHRNEKFVLADPEVQRFLREREFMGTELEQRRVELLAENRAAKRAALIDQVAV